MKKIILTLMMSAAVMASYAQADHEDVMNYRRKRLRVYTLPFIVKVLTFAP